MRAEAVRHQKLDPLAETAPAMRSAPANAVPPS